MGLFPWGFSQYLQKKFWVLVKKDGLLKTYLRQHATSRHSHYAGGLDEPIKPSGQDDFGNKYFEDFNCQHRNQRRWVEYSDYFLTLGVTGDRIPPKWHGWLAHVYDDVPSDFDRKFVNHSYIKPHSENVSYHPLHYKSYGSIDNQNRLDFIDGLKARRGKAWEIPESGSKLNGKKIVVEKNKLYTDGLS